MKLKDNTTLSIAAAVSDVVEGKVKKEEAKYPHDMFHPETGAKKVAKDEAEHNALADQGYTHEKPEVDEAGEPKAKGEKDFKAKHTVKKSGAKEDGTVVKEEDEEEVEEAKSKFPKALLKKATDLALKMGGNMTGAVKKIEKMKKGLSDDPEVKAALQLANEEVTEEAVAEAHAMNEAKSKMAEDKERYQKFFQSALKKFGVESPAQLKGDKKKEFFDYVDKNYEADNETDKDESVKEEFSKLYEAFNKAKEMKNLKVMKQLYNKASNAKFQVDQNDSDARNDMERALSELDSAIRDYEDEIKSGVHEGTIAEATYHNDYMWDGSSSSDIKADIKNWTKKYPGLKFKHTGRGAGDVIGDKKKIEKFLLDDPNMSKGEVKTLLSKGTLGMNFGGIHFDEGTIAEAQIRTSFEADEMKNVGGDKAAKKMKIKISFKKGKGDGYGGSDAGIFTGDEKNLVKYFQDYMGFEGKTFKELQKEYS